MTAARETAAVFLDFDGVILDSARLKTSAYVELYKAQPEAVRDEIKKFCDHYGGLPRDTKFRMIQETILRSPASAAELRELHERYTGLVYERVLHADWIPGAYELLTGFHRDHKLFIVSGSPHDELHEICRLRQIHSFFVDIGGGPTPKTEWMRRYFKAHALNPGDTVMVGDSLVDLQAAEECGARFIGVAGTNSVPFPRGTTLIDNLRNLPAVLFSAGKAGAKVL